MASFREQFLIRVSGAALFLSIVLLQGQAQPIVLEDLDSKSDPSFKVETLVSAAQQAYSENRFHDAIKLYSTIIKDSPINSSLFVARAMAYEMVNQSDKASADYKKALEIDPSNFQAMENLAALYEQTVSHMPEAVRLYREALKLDPRPEGQARLDFCIEVLERRLEPEESSAVGCWNLANRKWQKDNAQEAEFYYSKAIELDPRLFQAYFSRGLLRSGVGDLSGAIEDLGHAATLSPGLRGCLVARGLAYEAKGDDVKAQADFETAVVVDQRDPNAHYHLGRMLEKQGDYTRALQFYVEATRLKAKPDLRNLLQQRISAVMATGKVDLKSVLSPKRTGKDLW
ncbi:MAG: tetratricopeptide repeat protein [Deltaproteobacteria bacterium]|nr:tetratricopeptide repeat protein [Deltaproteobacteria bacterium]